MSSGLLPVAVYGLKVPAGDVMIPALIDFPATFRITMAAIDPSAVPEHTGTAKEDKPVRATLKMVYDPSGPGDEDDSEDDGDEEENYLRALLAGDIDEEDDDEDEEDEDDESSDDDEEKNGGPSDPTKTKKARKEAAVQQLLEAMKNENGKDDDDDDDEMDVDQSSKVNGLTNESKVDKGKGKAVEEDEDDDDENDEDELDGMEEVVICTLDPEKNYQQTLDITIPEDQNAYFKVSGTHAIYLTGNYVIPADAGHNHGPDYDDDDEDDEDEYDLEPDIDELDDEDESDELDDIDNPRVTEVGSEDEAEPPKLVKKEEPAKKGKNKRPAQDSEDETVNLDDIMTKSLKPETAAEEPKLSKKQLKKLKKNDGKPAQAAAESKDAKANDKKVQFAKDLESGPSSSPSTLNGDTKPGVKMVQGVKVDDKKLGKGPAAKKGNKVGMRYIGKLSNGKVFDSNKKGPPFQFKLGSGEVIRGWDIGVAGMAVGGERRIVVPANLAYGSKKLPEIPANSELTFDLKLLEIK